MSVIQYMIERIRNRGKIRYAIREKEGDKETKWYSPTFEVCSGVTDEWIVKQILTKYRKRQHYAEEQGNIFQVERISRGDAIIWARDNSMYYMDNT